MQSREVRCESCGYPVSDLEADQCCPECGRPVVQSLPHSRSGSPWQVEPWPFGFFHTAFSLLFRPREVFGAIRMDDRSWRGLLIVNLLVASFLLVDPWSGVFIGDPARGLHGEPMWIQLPVRALVLGVETLVGALVLGVVSMGVETLLRMAGVRGPVARQVVAHAGVGWVAFAGLPLLAMAAYYSVYRFGGDWVQGLAGKTVDLRPLLPDPLSVGTIAAGLLVGSGFKLGATILLSRYWIGYKRCRYCAAAGPAQVQLVSH